MDLIVASISTPFDGLAAGVSPADGAASRRTPEENSLGEKPYNSNGRRVFLDQRRRTAGLFFRLFRPYIGPWTAPAKADPARKRWTPSHAERHLQQAHYRAGRQYSAPRSAFGPPCKCHGPFQAVRLDREGRSQDGGGQGHRFRPRREGMCAGASLFIH